MRNDGEQVLLLITHQAAYGLQVGQELANASVPGLVAGRRVCLGPVTVREFGRLVLRIHAEVENVPLGNAHMLEYLPRSVGRSLGLPASELAGEVMQFAADVDVGFRLREQVDQVLANGVNVIHYLNSRTLETVRRAAERLPVRCILTRPQYAVRVRAISSFPETCAATFTVRQPPWRGDSPAFTRHRTGHG